MELLTRAWTQREEELYPLLFGELGEGIYTLPAAVFEQGFAQQHIQPEWLSYGVLEAKPWPRRNSWLYVSSGLSNPLGESLLDDAREDISGLGIEFVIETPEQAPWAVSLIHHMMAYHLLMVYGKFDEDIAALDYFDCIALGQAGAGLPFLMIVKPLHYPATAQLDSGAFDFFHLLGITHEEYQFAAEAGAEELYAILRRELPSLQTDPKRTSLI